MNKLTRRFVGSLTFGFMLVFIFVIFVQLTTDFLNWIFSFHIRFMFPFGLARAFEDMERFWGALSSVCFTALIVSAVFFVARGGGHRQRSIMDLDDDAPRD